MRAAIQIDGGIGRTICALPALERMAKEQELIIIAGHPEVFHNNPNFYKVYSLNREYIFDDVIQHCEFLNPEPYWDYHFYQKQRHIITSFNCILNKEEPIELPRPVIYLTDAEKQEASDYIKNIRTQIGNRKIIGFQPFGASFQPLTGKDDSHRSLPPNVVDSILNQLNDVGCFINFTMHPIKHPSMCYDHFPLRKLFALAPHCDYLITVDSFLPHLGFCFGIPGTEFFGGTEIVNFGYPEHYHTVSRPGYPKTYFAFRMAGFVDKNQGAMNFTEEELTPILEEIRARLGALTPPQEEPTVCCDSSCTVPCDGEPKLSIVSSPQE